jgi:choline dehydrogenase-like flavoprotein
VVGGGAAGITLVLELIRGGHDVVLLEGGGKRRRSSTQATYRGEIESSGLDARSVHPPLETVRVKKLGGTTGAWGGRCAPLDPIDFEKRDYVSHSGWPITRESLEPFYRRANAYCEAGEYEYSTSKSLPFADGFFPRMDGEAEITDSKLLRYSRPTDFGDTYRSKLEQSRILRAFHHANVLRLELDRGGNRIDAAVVASSPGIEFRVRARHFVIAAGGLESTRLLLVSGRHAGRGIGAGSKLIGHYYMTHLDGSVGTMHFKGSAPKAAYTYELTRDRVYCRRLICLTPDAQRAHRTLNFSAVPYLPSPDDPGHGDGLLSTFAVTKDAMYRAKVGIKSRRYGMHRPAPLHYRQHLLNIVRNPWGLPRFAVDWMLRRSFASRKLPSFLVETSSYRLLFSAEQSPSSANKIVLSDEWDAFGVPRLKVLWGVKGEDYQSIVTCLDVLSRSFDALGVGSIAAPRSVDELRDQMGGGFLGGTHAMGSTRMSASPINGVVDARCRVHGIQNLYVASSSVFPTSGFAAPTLTIVALAVRISDTIHAACRDVG